MLLNDTSDQRLPLGRLLSPRSVAIVGASATPGSFGASILDNLEPAGYDGIIHLINPKRSEINGRPCVASVDDLPEGVDCAVLAIPRASVLEAVKACARRGVGGVIIFTAGFTESGEAGRRDQEEIAFIARQHGIAIEGPNCLGMVNYVEGIPLTFVSSPVKKFGDRRGIAVISQSGALAAVLGVSLKLHDLDISFSVSTGNEAVTHVEDYVEYLLDDPHTQVITLIVEHFRRPAKFLAQARRATAMGKRIVLLHPGRSSAARASAATHTGAMAGDYQLMRTKVEHAGVVVVDTLEELIDVSQILLRCPVLPKGGCAVLTESGAFKALTLDLCESIGLSLPSLTDATSEALRKVLPDFILPTNPLDITAQGLVDPALYRHTLPPILDDPQYGSVVLGIILTDEATGSIKLPPLIDAIRSIHPQKPVMFAALDEGAYIPPEFVAELRQLGVPFFPSPERAFRALGRLSSFAGKQHRDGELVQLPKSNQPLPCGVIPEYASKQILSSLGIPIPAGSLAVTLQQANEIAAEIGYPVVLKAQSKALSHKSDSGGVALNLQNSDEFASTWQRMQQDVCRAHPGLVLDGILVEKMGRKGLELIVGAQNDPEWGPVLLVGLGGVLAEALNDVRLLPPELSEAAIVDELYQLKSAALLRGFRGSAALDVEAAARIVSRLGALMIQNPQIIEADINPVIVYPCGEGAIALDALIVTRQ
jgi:acetate---CoA ligase (ADP-forming)